MSEMDFSLGEPLPSSVQQDATPSAHGTSFVLQGSDHRIAGSSSIASRDSQGAVLTNLIPDRGQGVGAGSKPEQESVPLPHSVSQGVETILQSACSRALGEVRRLEQRSADLSAENDRLRHENGRLRDQSGAALSPRQERRGEEGEEMTRLRDQNRKLQDKVKELQQQLSGKSSNKGASCPDIGDQGDQARVGVITVMPQLVTKTSTQPLRNPARPREEIETPRAWKEPKPEDCARFLAKEMQSGDQFNEFLRCLDLSTVDIQDLGRSHPNDPREFRISSITSALSSAEDRLPLVLGALVKSRFRAVAESFCREFGIDAERIPRVTARVCSDPAERIPRVTARVSSPLPALPERAVAKPQNALEEMVWRFFKDPQNAGQLTADLSKVPDLNVSELCTFIGAVATWDAKEKHAFHQRVTEPYTVKSILNAWANIEKENGRNESSKSIEDLACALRDTDGLVVCLKCFRDHLHGGVLGPSQPRAKYLREYSYSKRKEVIKLLSLHDDWKILAEYAGFKTTDIDHWATLPNPAETLMTNWQTRNSNIGMLYEWAVKAKRLDIARFLESE